MSKDEIIKKCLSDFERFKQKSKGNVNLLETETIDANECDENYEMDFHSIISKPLIKNEDQSIFNIKADPMYETVQIADKKIEMEIDTGAYVTAISEENKLILFPNEKLFPCDQYLTSNSNVQLNPIGIIKKLTVEFKDKRKSWNIYIIKGKGPTLMGRQWLKEFGFLPLV